MRRELSVEQVFPVRPLHFGQSPERLGQDEIRAWQIYLVEEKRLAASSISVAVAALRFVYTVTLKRPWIKSKTTSQPAGNQKKLPGCAEPCGSRPVPGRSEKPGNIEMILTAVCYATECRYGYPRRFPWKPTAIDSQRMVIPRWKGRAKAGKTAT